MKLIHHPSLRLNHLFYDDFLTKNPLTSKTNSALAKASTFPAANVIPTPDSFRIEMAIPGLQKQDFTIQLDNEMLCVSAAQQENNALEEGSQYVQQEFQHLAFERRFRLSKTLIVPNEISATYTDGILRITIPKKEEAKELPPRQIEVT